MINVGIVGATGYAGEMLVWLLNKHPNVKIQFLASKNHDEEEYDTLYKNFFNLFNNKCTSIDKIISHMPKVDLIFTALPHGKSFELVKTALDNNIKVIDIGSDYRIKDSHIYSEWYNVPHKYPDFLKTSVYGLPEVMPKDVIKASKLIANPGCYPTASILALSPLLKYNLIDENSIIIDAKSGVSGAGRSALINTLFCECNESIKAYNIGCHRHIPEIEQQLSLEANKNINISFTPHLVPMNRGILATCYASLKNNLSKDIILNCYKEYYKNEQFVRLTEAVPETRWVKNSNFCDINFQIDKRTNRIIIVSAIDNVVKGAAGQAVQNMNIMFGFPETTSLDILPVFP